jgi:glycosyltransferase involved in cell wall biosynthesis
MTSPPYEDSAPGGPFRDDTPVPVTVVIAAFDREDTVGRAIRSAQAQRPAPAEILVIDDASTDGTAAAAEAAGATVIVLERNGGAAVARNAGIAAATQPWIAFLDSDDEWLPEHLRVLWPLTREHDLVTGGTVAVDDATGIRSWSGVRRPTMITTPTAIVYPDNFISSGGVLVSVRALCEAGGFDTTLRYSEDLDLWLRVLERWEGIAVPEPVVLYHRHSGQKTNRLADARRAQWELLLRYRDREWWSEPAYRKRVALNRCELQIVAGQRSMAVRRLVAGLARDPRTYAAVALTLVAQSLSPRIPQRLRRQPAGTR